MWIDDDERRALRDSAARFLSQQCDFARHRRRLAADAPLDRALWRRFAELGWLGMLLPDSVGGLGLRSADALAIVQAMGAQFVVEPYQETLAAAHLLLATGDAAQHRRWLPGLCDGSALTLPAHAEHGARYELRCVQTRAVRAGTGYRLDGAKCALPFGAEADRLLVSARTAGAAGDADGISLFVVERGAHGLHLQPRTGLGGEPWADAVLDGVVVAGEARLGAEGAAFGAIAAAHDLLLAAACAEAVGTLQAVLDASCAYARTRRQFGQPLAGFQVIAHRLVDMFTQVEQARALAGTAAAQLADPAAQPAARGPLLLAACKAQVSAACRLVGEQAVQVHGGIGMTDELAVSHQVRRLLAIERRLGDRFHHLGVLGAAVAGGGGLYA